MSRYHRVGDVFTPIVQASIQHHYAGVFFVLIEKNSAGWWNFMTEEGRMITRPSPPDPRYWKFVENLGSPPPEGWTING